MELYLMRHGEAHESTVDPTRSLTEGGRATVERMARVAAERGVRVARVYHSGILRAQQTADLLAQHVATDAQVEHRPGLEPEDPVGRAAQWLLDCAADPETSTMAVVSHLPFLERLAEELVAGTNGSRTPAFRPATLAKLVPDSGASGFKVEWVMHPEGLR
jgi:phosphohistidine phosphatase